MKKRASAIPAPNTNSPNRYRVLLVPDSGFWVTATIARAIASHGKGIDPIVCSEPVLSELLSKNGGRFPLPVDIVHFLTPHVATRLFPFFANTSACIATIHHVEDEKSTEPANYVDAVTTGCEYWRDHHCKYVCDPQKVVMVRYGLDTSKFCPAKNERIRKSLRRKYGIKPDSFVVGFSAKRTSDSSNRKGINVLETLMETSAQRMDGITWIVRGPGWQSLVERLRKSGVDISYLPFLAEETQVAESYRVMDAFVVTARIEGGPYPLIEAMSSGVPVVSTPVGLALEVIMNGETGRIIPFDDSLAAYNSLVEIRSDKGFSEKLIRNGREIICNTLTWEKSLESLPELYRVSRENFEKRQPSGLAAAATHPDIVVKKRRLRRWIEAREFAAFSEFLSHEGCYGSARYFANRAIKCTPFDREILHRCAPKSTLAKPYNIARFLNTFLKF